ncbi:unnamed protein product [Rhizophagus irregularis]|nr:unnamed protein product [Rhizophagus irregularis]
MSVLWCELSVRILWRNTLNIKFDYKHSFKIESSILSTLIACLPNESKKLLHDNKIFISTPTSNPLLFNYASFCKTLSIYEINRMIDSVLKNKPSLDSKYKNSLVANEIIKMFASQISSLKKLIYYHTFYYNLNVSFPHFPGARDLLELCYFYDSGTNELKELISSQNNLKNLNLSAFNGSWADIIPSLTKHSRTITKLKLYSDDSNSFSFVSSFPNLQKLTF